MLTCFYPIFDNYLKVLTLTYTQVSLTNKKLIVLICIGLPFIRRAPWQPSSQRTQGDELINNKRWRSVAACIGRVN